VSAIAQLKALFSIDTKQGEAAIDSIGNKVKQLGTNQLAGLKGMIAGAFSVGVIASFGRKILQTADDLQTAANTFGTSMQTMIALKSVMAESGIGAEKFMRVFGKLNASVSEAKAGVKTYTDAFAAMNIAQEDLIGLDVDKVLELMAKRYGEANSKAEFLAATSKALGERIGPQLIEVFQRINKEGLEKFSKEAESAAAGMETLAQASDNLERSGNNIILWAGTLIGYLNQMYHTLLDVTQQWISFGEAWRQNSKPEVVEVSDAVKKRAAQRGGQAAPEYEPNMTDAAREEKMRVARVAKEEEKAAQEKSDRAKELFNLYAQQNELKEREKELLAGTLQPGISSPERGRVDSLQAVGGLIGGAGGTPSDRRAEKQLKVAEDTQKELQRLYSKMDEVRTEIAGLREDV
jgi:hypothetical protein